MDLKKWMPINFHGFRWLKPSGIFSGACVMDCTTVPTSSLCSSNKGTTIEAGASQSRKSNVKASETSSGARWWPTMRWSTSSTSDWSKVAPFSLLQGLKSLVRPGNSIEIRDFHLTF